jgi:ketosteroid isomerase-like protein
MAEPSLEQKVQLLWDHQAIEDVLYRYARGFDRRDMDIAKGAYWPDALDDHPGYVGNAHAMADFFDAFHEDRWESTHHHTMNNLIEIDGDTAHAESLCFVAATKKGTLELELVGGRYVRRLEKRDGEWRIAAAVLIADWSLDPAMTVEMLETGAKAATGRSDPSYDRPLQVTRERTDVGAEVTG